MDKIMLSSIFNNLYRFLIEEEATMGVRAEKDVATRMFNQRRTVKWIFEAMAVLFVLVQSSTYWLPIASDLLRETVAIFRSHLFVFALFNSIILAVYVLSAKIPRPSNDAAWEPKDLYEEFVTNSRRNSAEEEPNLFENVGEESEGKDCTEKALVVGANSHSPHYHHQRTRSATFQMKTTIGEESQRHFRRSYTDIRRRLTSYGGDDADAMMSSAVDRMSDEDFNRRIEDFIAAHKWTQQEEYKEERKTERFTMALTTTVCQ